MSKDLLSILDLDAGEIHALIEHAGRIKSRPSRYTRALYERTLLMIFEAPSLRTRLSFETALTQLHGHAINYYTVHSPWGRGKETIEDVARTVSRYCDAVCARLFSHAELEKLAAHATVPVINAMTDAGHPCQVLADLMTIEEKLGRAGCRRLAYVGDARNNVTYSLMQAGVLTGVHVVVGCPADERYRPDPRVLDELAALAERCPGRADVVEDPAEAVAGADVVYADSWMSYRVPPADKERRLRDLAPYRVDARLFAKAGESAFFMHCLPAMRGQEVAGEVIDGPRSIVFDQAENRLHLEKALLLRLLARGRA